MVIGQIEWMQTTLVEAEDTGTLYLIQWPTLSNRVLQYKGQARYTTCLAARSEYRGVDSKESALGTEKEEHF